tara:strand:- start:505 stop:900 length:396 start_codon:yes stop_codon:yes gene_type:complete
LLFLCFVFTSISITSHIRTSIQSIEENKKALLASSNLVVESAVGVTEGEECLELLENSSSDSKAVHQEIIMNQDSNGNQDSGNGAAKEEENIIEINNRLMRSGEKGAASESKGRLMFLRDFFVSFFKYQKH